MLLFVLVAGNLPLVVAVDLFELPKIDFAHEADSFLSSFRAAFTGASTAVSSVRTSFARTLRGVGDAVRDLKPEEVNEVVSTFERASNDAIRFLLKQLA